MSIEKCAGCPVRKIFDQGIASEKGSSQSALPARQLAAERITSCQGPTMRVVSGRRCVSVSVCGVDPDIIF